MRIDLDWGDRNIIVSALSSYLATLENDIVEYGREMVLAYECDPDEVKDLINRVRGED